MDPAELHNLEKLCATLYAQGGAEGLIDKLEAQRQLLRLQSSAQYLPHLQYTLEHSKSEYALLFASKGMLLVLSNDWRNVSSADRVALQRFLLQLLATHMDPSNFVTRSIIRTLCRLTKLGWCSDPSLRGLVDEMVQFLNAGVPHAVLGLRILSELISEFELGKTEPSGRLDPEGRIVAQAFREQDGLTRIFQLALDTVNAAFRAGHNKAILREALRTLHTCLAYDFVGTGYNESDDVVACLYIPVQWTKHIATANALKQLFQIYQAQWQGADESEVDAGEQGAASLALQCIGLVSSTRRSVFDEKTRQEFLVALLEGTTMLMQEKTGLSHSESCLHHLCRVLSRIKSHFQLVELAKPPQYHVWLQTLATFTEEILAAWRAVSTRSVHYLIRLWGALVLPTPYLRMRDGLPRTYEGPPEHPGAGSAGQQQQQQHAGGPQQQQQQQPNYLRGLDQYVPRVVQAFISTRADMCSAAALDELDGAHREQQQQQGYGNFGKGHGGIEDNPLDDEGMLLEQLTPLSLLARFRYGVSASAAGELYLSCMSDRSQAISVLTSSPAGSPQQAEAKLRLADAQARLAFLTYLIGAIVGAHVTRVSARAIDRLEELNAELAALVFKMVTDSQRTEEAIQAHGESPAVLIFGTGSDAGWRLELATLYFFRCFQTLYIESRAREDDLEKRGAGRNNRAIELVEDPTGFMSFSFLRRGAVAGPSASLVAASGHGSGHGSGGSASTALVGMQPGAGLFPLFQMRALPSAAPSMDLVSRGLLPLLRGSGESGRSGRSSNNAESSGKMDDDEEGGDGSDQQAAQSKVGDGQGEGKRGTPCPSPIVVDELSAAELAKKEREMNEEATARASAMQRSIAHRVGVQGGDRALLDIAMRRIFGLLQYAQHANKGSGLEDASAPVMLVQRALSVLYQLTVGVTIVHAGRVLKPRLVSSGRLLLESEVIRDLLRNPSAELFPLLKEPRHGRARSFLMATLSKLLYTQIRYPNATGSTDDVLGVGGVAGGGGGGGGGEAQGPGGQQLTPQDKADERFIAFMKPMTEVADGLLQVAASGDLRRPDLKGPIVGLCRDLRGVISSATATREYELVFAWFFPQRVKLLALLARVWNDDYEVMVPMLKLLSELVHNRGSRIVFPHLSPGGLVLFREASNILVAFCTPQLHTLEQLKETQRAGQEKRQRIKEKLGSMGGSVVQSLQAALGSDAGAGGSSDPLSMQALQEAVEAMGEEFFSSGNRGGGGGGGSGERLSGNVVQMGPSAEGPGITVDLESLQQKCSRVCLVTLSRMLSGRYALLGTFQLFGDPCLLDARRVVLELALSGSPRHVMSFPKMARALIQLLGLLADQFIFSLIDLSSPLFARVIGCLGEALASSQASLSTPAARTVEAIAVFRCKAMASVRASSDDSDPAQRIRAVLSPEHRSRGDTTSLDEYRRAAQVFAMHEGQHPNLFGSLLGLIMHTMFSSPTLDSPNQWSIAKSVMPLVFAAPSEFEQQRKEFLNAQSAEREPRIREAFDQLFSKLAPALSNPAMSSVLLRSNDTFTKQLCSFCRDLRRE